MTEENSDTSQNPLVVFLGLCERATYVREGNTNLFKWNILGLKTVVLSYIYPLRIDHLAIGFAFPATISAEEAKFRIADSTGDEVGTLNLMASIAKPTEEDFIQQKAEPFLLVPEHGWTAAFLPLAATGWIVKEPGVYYLEQLTSRGPVRIGTIQFAVVDPEPLSPDRVAAIKSDPGAAKSVRFELGCKHCPAKYRVYAALEASTESEKDGWIWYQNAEAKFTCECGRTTIDLEHIRRNLHGLLGHQMAGRAKAQIMPMYERSSLQSIRNSFGKLVSSEPREESLQQFLHTNPILFHQFPAEKIIPKPPILTAYVADFGIVTAQKELLFIEIEKTTTRLMKKDGDMAAHTRGQVSHCTEVPGVLRSGRR